MKMIIEFTREDLLRSKIVNPAWYRVRIDSVETALSKNGDSTNIILKGVILFDADTGSTEFADVPTPYWNFNTKAKGFMVGFFNALGVEINEGSRVDFDAVVGKEVEVFIENDLFEGKVVNRINHKYRAIRG